MERADVGTKDSGPNGRRDAVDVEVRRVVADRLGVDAELLSTDVSLTDELAADSLDLLELAVTLEAECGLVLSEEAIAELRTYGDLLDAAVAAERRRSAPAPLLPVFAHARVVPAGRGARGTLERAEQLTPYTVELIGESALRVGPGARLEMELPKGTAEADMDATRRQFEWLASRGVEVSVRRSRRAPEPSFPAP
ncbi:MAG TPA: acyl carrier protein [Candidatus Binatia bacterium]|nr:acyl carrier protein [Candidatus Binatia bacterium]